MGVYPSLHCVVVMVVVQVIKSKAENQCLKQVNVQGSR